MYIFGGIILLAGGVVLLMGCDLGIDAVCKLQEKLEGLGEKKEEIPDEFAEGMLPPEPMFERLTITTVMDALAEMAVVDIDDCTFFALGREKRFNLKSVIFKHYKSWLEEIAENNDVSLKPLSGRALAKYAQLILDVSRRSQIRLNPACENQLRSELFSGTPLLGQTTANYAVTLS